MLKIEVAKTAGFCFGVDRAVKMIYKMLEEGEKVATLGPIIHNETVVSDLKSKGALTVDSPADVPPWYTLVIRTHGVARSVIEEAEKLGVKFVDATCPFVLKIHKIVRRESEAGKVILIAGDAKHPEVMGITGNCPGEFHVFKNETELDEIIKNHPEFAEKSLAAVTQTTFSVKEWEKCVKKINLVYTNSFVFDTICSATGQRQAEAVKLSSHCDTMLVIGGRSSSNTAKLFDVCSSRCKAYHIESAAELSRLNFEIAVALALLRVHQHLLAL